ncbi:uncharacterized protein LOC114759125 [Neltuma alba]|uniref:uncharacterized protein LOC114759125 n=1 Tax=Neltuma alba TaxID=207710 RepID=UPI0010A42DB4|nr:uncharacterized protein LOC114759125 [Prosopis alba]
MTTVAQVTEVVNYLWHLLHKYQKQASRHFIRVATPLPYLFFSLIATGLLGFATALLIRSIVQSLSPSSVSNAVTTMGFAYQADYGIETHLEGAPGFVEGPSYFMLFEWVFDGSWFLLRSIFVCDLFTFDSSCFSPSKFLLMLIILDSCYNLKK